LSEVISIDLCGRGIAGVGVITTQSDPFNSFLLCMALSAEAYTDGQQSCQSACADRHASAGMLFCFHYSWLLVFLFGRGIATVLALFPEPKIMPDRSRLQA
jgi:hypothetical protein